MILGVDHITINVANASQEVELLKNNGYNCVFYEKGILNHPAKKILLKHLNSSHDLFFLRPKGMGLSVEIVNHGDELAGIATPYVYVGGNRVKLFTADLFKEIIFWQKALCFTEIASNILSFVSPVSNWTCEIVLEKCQRNCCCTLDSKGFTCLAILTNDIITDMQLAEKCGAYSIIGPFDLIINGKKLVLSMFRTPSGAICELVML